MNCPKCHCTLSRSGRCDDCGWTERAKPEAPQRPHVPCAFEGCPRDAVMRVRVGPRIPGKERRNWSNVCSLHDVELVQKEADDWMRAVGLGRQPDESTRAWRLRTLEWLKQNGEKQQHVRGFRSAAALLGSQRQREPGDDDEQLSQENAA